MNKNELMELLKEVEEEKRKNRYLEKVSLSEFSKAVKKNNGDKYSDVEIEEMYNKLPSPARSTLNAGGYDFYAPYDFVLEPGETIVIPTGFKVHMNDDEIFNLFIRSGTGFKYNVRLSNQVGIIDADYYGNESNEGHMFISFTNHGKKPWENKGLESKMAQGIFMPYYITRDDNSLNNIRKGGLGSTSK